MPAPVTSTKILPESLRLLKDVSATTGEKMYAILRRLLEQEARRLDLPVKRDKELIA